MLLMKTDYDAIVVGSGPNGLAAAVTLQKEGLSVLLIEGKETPGGGLRTSELTLPGFKHDVCSAIHPLAAGSPYLQTLPLEEHGLEYVFPDICAAHPFDDGTAAVLTRSLEETVASLGQDGAVYRRLVGSLVKDWPRISADVLSPLGFPSSPMAFFRFGVKAIQPAQWISKSFATTQARGLWAGMAGHSIQPFGNFASSAIGFVLMAAGHLKGWPIPKGGSQSIADALVSYFISLGGKVITNTYISALSQLPSSKAVLFDVTPKQLLQIAGYKFSSIYKWQLNNYRYGMGVFKVDYALESPVPFTAASCRNAGTVHLGNSYEEIAGAEQMTWEGKHPENPFVLLAQQSLFDPTRAPEGKHTLWAYCHVPNGSVKDMSAAIEKQIERFAPGFRDCIRSKHVMNTSQMEAHNPNYIGGDINGGVIDVRQLFTRPALRSSPYRTSAKGIYICSSSTPPGGGVHGMCGYHAAGRALKDIFRKKPAPLKS